MKLKAKQTCVSLIMSTESHYELLHDYDAVIHSIRSVGTWIRFGLSVSHHIPTRFSWKFDFKCRVSEEEEEEKTQEFGRVMESEPRHSNVMKTKVSEENKNTPLNQNGHRVSPKQKIIPPLLSH